MDCCKLFHILLFFTPTLFLIKSSNAAASIAPSQALIDNGTTLVSDDGSFELGFFSPSNSSSRYLGIWFKKIPKQTVVWVANRDAPITDSTGSLSITDSGMIVIFKNRTDVFWTANSSAGAVKNPILKLLDNGNLVLKTTAAADNDPGGYLWQSFDSPLDTLIPGMNLGWDLGRNREWYLTSWRNAQDPSPGDYTYRMNPAGLPSTILRQGSKITFRSGPWDGVRFGGDPIPLQQNAVFKPIFVYNSTNVYYAFENTDVSIISRFVVSHSGQVNHFMWSQTRNQWIDIASMLSDLCDDYSACGNFGVCEVNKSPMCRCLSGFDPRQRQEWSQFNWEEGCVRRTPLNCSRPTGFRKFSSVKVPDTSNSVVNATAMNREKCEKACLRNCACVAYAMTQAGGCVQWSGDLVDIRVYAEGGMELFVRMPSSELDSGAKSKTVTAVITSLLGVVVLTLVLSLIWLIIKRIAKKKTALASHPTDNPSQVNHNPHVEDDDMDLPVFDFPSISSATGEFAFANKIGEGGFGRVYKGVLSNGREIAVKRLSKDSGQGLRELKNEVILISKLQHRNLVRLLGCCIHGDERMLVYEYVHNRSLDMFIFNRHNDKPLDWQTRFDIIVGIARGLLYLHRDSRLRIIHRDLKASNVLLDSEMNPKISDFGLARTFRSEHYQDTTNRIMGTYGYMAPEYAVDGQFSVKSDVFSFGVLVLEIVNGKRNRGFYHPDHHLNLLGHAWKLWNEGNSTELLDSSLKMPYIESEVVRCIQVGLLCVQQHPEDRPTMSDALLMLDSEHSVLAQPKQPGFYTERDVIDTESSSTGKMPHTSNEITVTLLHGR